MKGKWLKCKLSIVVLAVLVLTSAFNNSSSHTTLKVAIPPANSLPYTFVPIENGSRNPAYHGAYISSSQTVDLQSGWWVNIPSNAVAIEVAFAWKGSIGNWAELVAGPSSNSDSAVISFVQTNNVWSNNSGIVPIHNGDIYLRVGQPGYVIIRILGYFVPQGSSSPYTFIPIKDGNRNPAYHGAYISSSQTVDLQSGWWVNIPSSAVAVEVAFAWKGNVGNWAELAASPSSEPAVISFVQANNVWSNNSGIVPIHNGDIYLRVGQPGYVIIRILGYFVPQGSSPSYTFIPIEDGNRKPAYHGAYISSSQTVDLQSGWLVNIPSSAVAVEVAFAWKGNVGNWAELAASPSSEPAVISFVQANNVWSDNSGIVPIHNGDIYLRVGQPGYVIIRVLGYFVDWASASANTKQGVAFSYSAGDQCGDMSTLNSVWLRQWDPRPLASCTGIESVPTIHNKGQLGELTADTNQGTLGYYGSNAIRDSAQFFAQWDPEAGEALFKIRVTNTDASLTWAYLGGSFPCSPSFCDTAYKDTGLSTPGWNGAGIVGKVPASYIVSPAVGNGGKTLGGNSQYIMGFYEPDKPSQSNLSPEAAVPLWRMVERMYGSYKLLVSPAPSLADPQWLLRFRNAYYAKYQRYPQLDALGAHCIDETPFGPTSYCQGILQNYINWANTWPEVNKGIWVGDFWFGNGSEYYTNFTEAERERSLTKAAEFITWMNAEPQITRYAWYSHRDRADCPGGLFCPSTPLLDKYGNLTPYGEMYVMFHNP